MGSYTRDLNKIKKSSVRNAGFDTTWLRDSLDNWADDHLFVWQNNDHQILNRLTISMMLFLTDVNPFFSL